MSHMPELAEVELARRMWNNGVGQTVQSIQVEESARIFRSCPVEDLESLVGEKLRATHRHGKRFYVTFGQRLHLEIHLGMTGKVSYEPAGYEHKKHDHLMLILEDGVLVLNDYRMFGKVSLHRISQPWGVLPPDPLSPEFTNAYVKKLKERKPNLKLKSVLLNQEFFPGVGNWMADEICWRLRLHPATQLKHVSAKVLYQEALYVCQGAITYVTEGNESAEREGETGFAPGGYVANVPPEEWLFQHRWKKGGFCPRCDVELERGTVATRTTAWCAKCQPLI